MCTAFSGHVGMTGGLAYISGHAQLPVFSEPLLNLASPAAGNVIWIRLFPSNDRVVHAWLGVGGTLKAPFVQKPHSLESVLHAVTRRRRSWAHNTP